MRCDIYHQVKLVSERFIWRKSAFFAMTHAILQRFYCLRTTHKVWKFMQYAFIRIDKTVYHWSMGHHKCMQYVVRIRSYMAQRLCYSSAHSNKASNRMVMFKLLLVPLSHPVICCKTMCMQCSNAHMQTTIFYTMVWVNVNDPIGRTFELGERKKKKKTQHTTKIQSFQLKIDDDKF